MKTSLVGTVLCLIILKPSIVSIPLVKTTIKNSVSATDDNF